MTTEPLDTQAKPEPARAPNFMEIVAREKAGERAKDWEVYCWELIGDHETSNDYLVGIGQTRLKTRGARKGSRTWSDTKGKMLPNTKVVVTGAEMDAARAKYEAETGKCHECGGSGQYCCGWSAAEGNRYRTCSRCSGTGKAPGAKA